jgi:hypothetical protein
MSGRGLASARRSARHAVYFTVLFSLGCSIVLTMTRSLRRTFCSSRTLPTMLAPVRARDARAQPMMPNNPLPLQPFLQRKGAAPRAPHPLAHCGVLQLRGRSPRALHLAHPLHPTHTHTAPASRSARRQVSIHPSSMVTLC